MGKSFGLFLRLRFKEQLKPQKTNFRSLQKARAQLSAEKCGTAHGRGKLCSEIKLRRLQRVEVRSLSNRHAQPMRFAEALTQNCAGKRIVGEALRCLAHAEAGHIRARLQTVCGVRRRSTPRKDHD
jgi:hypothetical protein